MTHPEERVLVGAVTRKSDLNIAKNELWYRIPQEEMPRGINAEYIAFYTRKSVVDPLPAGIHYYARITGLELFYRRDLVPHQPDHKHADRVYYRLAFKELLRKDPPVLNPANRRFAFIRTTWDRFIHAAQIKDLYSTDDYFVDRIYHALKNRGLHMQQYWEDEQGRFAFAPGLSILCEDGRIARFSTQTTHDAFYLDRTEREDRILQAILEEIKKRGGPATIGIPPE